MRRKLTKKHIFDYEMKYKHLLNNKYRYDKLTLKNFDSIVYSVDYSFGNNYKVIFKFIDDYVDLIDFEKFTSGNYNFMNDHYKMFIKKYNQYFNKKTWTRLTIRLSNRASRNEDLIRKYKDKLDSGILTSYHTFSPELLLDLQDKVNVKKVLAKIAVINDGKYKCEINKRVNDYIMDHLEEVLTYKKGEKQCEEN